MANAELDIERVSVNFLSPGAHPELLGRLGRYDVERVIGVGGMGIVLKAYDSELHRVVAIKVLAEHLATNSSARKRFAREAQAAAAVVHANVIPIFNVETDGKHPFLVMQQVEQEADHLLSALQSGKLRFPTNFNQGSDKANATIR